MNISHFKNQHLEILQILHHIQSLCAGNVVASHNDIARELIRLRFKVKLHLSAEDKLLFPQVQANSQQNMVQFLQPYHQEMSELAGAFLDFIQRWELAESIREQPQQFCQEASSAIYALSKRIQKENIELYPRIEQLN